jgi:hypothetical protein
MWRDISSLQLINDWWHLDPHTPSEQDSEILENISLINAPHKGRYLETFKFGFAEQLGKVLLIPRKNQGVGCRVVGLLMSTIAQHLFENTHTRVYIQTDPPIPERGLLTLNYLCDPQRRREIYQNSIWEYSPSNTGESPKDYETRVVNIMANRLAGYESLKSSWLTLKKVRSKLDGLFYSREKRELVIVEAKHRKADFSEGAAQLILYYAQAKNRVEFRNLNIRTHLITSQKDNIKEYDQWKRIMNSKVEAKFFCQ